jgi:hypothetical protein
MNRVVCPSGNLLATHRRTVERDWDYDAYGDLRPEDFLPGAPRSSSRTGLRSRLGSPSTSST